MTHKPEEPEDTVLEVHDSVLDGDSTLEGEDNGQVGR
jgi:hypothetical protein